MPIRLFDSLKRETRELRPSQPDGVYRFYNCGPTVYAPAHIGNFRTFVVNDIIRRMLELEFGADKVRHVRNLTDVDDRTITQAKKENRPLGEITAHWTKLFHEDCDALNLLRPHVEPTATGHIAEQVGMIEQLMQRGHAYAATDGSVYFKIASFPGYGGLSRIRERELLATDTAADSDHKNNVGDFALWKAFKPEDDGAVQWPGPHGAAAGRPGWHIECSAMSRKHLGETIDLHTGGVDLLFPHHENEIAQSECCTGALFAHHWYHSEHLLVNGTTMSKSKGNYFTVRDLLAKGATPAAIRYALLAGHPRKQLNFTLDSLHAAEKALLKLRTFAETIASNAGVSLTDIERNSVTEHHSTPTAIAAATARLNEDLNTPAALGSLFAALDIAAKHPHGTARAQARDLGHFLFATGITLPRPKTYSVHLTDSIDVSDNVHVIRIPAEVTALAEKRWAAKAAKDFKAADALRAEITAAGWQMLDRKDGYSLEPLKK